MKKYLTKPVSASRYILGGASLIAIIIAISLATHASTPSTSQEAESGTLSSCASQLGDSSASGSSAVQFGSCQTDGFAHPGVLLDKNQLDFVKAKVSANQQPWLDAFNKAKADWRGSDTFPTNLARADVDCGASGNPDNGCSDIQNSSEAAYTQALLWYITGQSKYATKARAIIDNYSSTLQEFTNYNADFQASWSAELFVPAAELLRYSPGSGWTQSETDQFTAMLNRAYVSLVDQTRSTGGANRLMEAIDATMDIAVFENDRDMFNDAVSRWRQEVLAVIYLSSDTNPGYANIGTGYPKVPRGVSYFTDPNVSANTMDTYWWKNTSSPGVYNSGLEGETCRDMGHTTYGFNATIHAAQTAYLQGLDLYAEQQNRIVTGLEFNMRYIAQQLSTGSVPSNVCGGTIKQQTYHVYPAGWELGYAHYHDVMGLSMPYTKAFLDSYVRDSANTVLFTVMSGDPTLSFAKSN